MQKKLDNGTISLSLYKSTKPVFRCILLILISCKLQKCLPGFGGNSGAGSSTSMLLFRLDGEESGTTSGTGGDPDT